MAVQTRQRWTLFASPGAEAAAPRRPDYVLLGITGLILLLGMVMIYSVSFGPNVQGGKENPISLFLKHVTFIAVGLALLFFLTRVDYHLAERFALPAMGLTLLVLAGLLLLPGEYRRWVGGTSFQPSEVAKLVTVIYVAAWLSSKGAKLRNLFYGIIPFSIMVGLVAGLIAAEPNYSTAILIAATAFAMFFLAGADLVQFGMLLLSGGSVAAAVISRSPKAMERINSLMGDPFGATNEFWQLRETLIALGSGGMFGKGLGVGGGQYGWVPLAHSDTILAVWGEETGLFGMCIVIALFLFLAYRGFLIASQAPDDFGRLLASGATIWIFVQALVNMGVVTQIVPFTGQPLPLISYGGSSMIVTLAAIGLILSVARGKPKPVPARVRTERAEPLPAARPERQEPTPRGTMRQKNATVSNGGWNGRPRLSGARRVSRPPRTRPRQ